MLHHIRTIIAALLMLVSPAFAATKEWVTVTNCTLVHNSNNDGDSFHVIANGKECVMRLYFVDCPETDLRFPDRVSAQAAYFGIATNDAVRVGKDAAAFTATRLAKPFVILTRWQDAAGSSKLRREYATVTTATGDDLGELLVAAGLARIHGINVGDIGAERVKRLQALEDKAKSKHVGAWALAKP